MQKQLGQSLVEVIIALGVLVVIVVGFTSLILTSLQNTQYARRQEGATQYARNAIEIVRVIRDQNAAVTPETGAAFSTFNDLYGTSAGTTAPLNCYTINDLFPNYSLQQRNCNNNISKTLHEDGLYTQVITMVKPSGDELIRVTATVSWQDARGTHQSELITELSKWQ